MKESDAVRVVADLLDAYSGPSKLRAKRILNEISSACSWDPEELLPERLSVENDGSVGVDPTGAVWRLCDFSIGLSRERQTDISREAVRRWNTWPVIERLVKEASPGSVLATRLRLILDGKEGE